MQAIKPIDSVRAAVAVSNGVEMGTDASKRRGWTELQEYQGNLGCSGGNRNQQ